MKTISKVSNQKCVETNGIKLSYKFLGGRHGLEEERLHDAQALASGGIPFPNFMMPTFLTF